jgi:hypothetical protein
LQALLLKTESRPHCRYVFCYSVCLKAEHSIVYSFQLMVGTMQR